jgi:signal transduction histidine kinase/ligand-binding sensor domain-containing protein
VISGRGFYLANIIFFIFIGVASDIAWSQSNDISSASLIRQGYYTQYTGDNGLISNGINSSLQAQDGFIWITTYNGIMRFDGRKVDVFDRSNIPFLTTDAFYKVYEDHEGKLWFASQGSGIVTYKNSKFQRLDSTGVLPKSVRCLLMDADGSVWAGANNAGLYHIKDGQITHINLPELNEVSILELAKDRKGILWIATDGQGLFKFDGNKLHAVDNLLSRTVNTLIVTTDNTLLVGTTNGLNILRDGKLTVYDSLLGYQINCLIYGKEGSIWVGTELGLADINFKDQKFEFMMEKQGYPMARINHLSFDRENSLWVSTGRNGLVQLRESSIQNFTTLNGLTNNKVNVIYEGPDKKFYIGTDAGVVDVYDKGLIKSLPIKLMSADAGIRDILIDSKGEMWVGSYKGLLQIVNGKEKLFTEKDGMPAVDLRRIIEDNEGNIWVATRSAGIAKFKDGHITQVYDKTNGLKSNYILALEKNKNGEILVGTHSGGLSIIRKSGEVQTFHFEKDDSGILIFNIHIDEQGKIWIVSNIGLLYFDGEKFIPLVMTKMAKGETYFDWVEDLRGNVWITTNIGLFRIAKKEVWDFLHGKIKVITPKLFDNQDGMKTKECTGATHSILFSTGALWVPTIGGVSVLNPDKFKINTIAPPVYVTAMLVDNKEYKKLNNEVSIEPGNFRFTFYFTALSYASPSKNRFKYKLTPIDKDWIEAGNSRQAEYTNLRPGSYQFQVIACNSDEVWNTTGATVSLKVNPFFYQTFWFYAILILLFASILYGIYNWRIRVVERRNAELRKVNSELDRFVYSASHDLRAPLASILGLINVARLDSPDKVEEYLQKIQVSVHKLDGFIRDIIDFSRNARVEMEVVPIHFNELIHEVIENMIYLDEKNLIKRIVNVKGSDVFHTDKKRLTIVLNNLISNSIKYFNPNADNPFIEITVQYNSQQAIIVVKDNGIGIAPEHVNNIFKMFYRGDEKSRGSGLGLYIVNETVDKIKGTISVESDHGKGSTFTVVIPSLPHARQSARMSNMGQGVQKESK